MSQWWVCCFISHRRLAMVDVSGLEVTPNVDEEYYVNRMCLLTPSAVTPLWSPTDYRTHMVRRGSPPPPSQRHRSYPSPPVSTKSIHFLIRTSEATVYKTSCRKWIQMVGVLQHGIPAPCDVFCITEKQHWFNAGPALPALARHCTNVAVDLLFCGLNELFPQMCPGFRVRDIVSIV